MAIRTYGNIKLHAPDEKGKDYWYITKAEPHVCIKLKALFNHIPKGSPQPFLFLNTPALCNDLIWFMERYPLNISDEDAEVLAYNKKEHISHVNAMEAILLPDYVPREVNLKEGKTPRHYQLIGMETYMKCKRILIGDDIGLGKTLIGILSALQPGTTPCAIVVQTHMPKQWKDAIEEFTDLKVHLIAKTKPYNLPEADVYVFKYSQLSGWSNFYESGFFKSTVFDEVQELRHSGSNKYYGGKTLSKNVNYCLGLSATPIYNFGDEIFNILDLINENCLGSHMDFSREWCGFNKIVTDPQALGTFLRENFLMLRRTRKEVNRELPPINKIVHTVSYDENIVRKSEDIARQLAIKATTGSFMERGQAARELDIMVRHDTGVSKAKEVAEYVKMILENGEPVVLAGWHREVYSIWLTELAQYNPVMYTGTESPTQKEQAKMAFVNGETNLFIISLRSGIGLDGLQHRCSMMVIGELDWSPKVLDQLAGRIDRDGQQDQVTVVYLVSEYGSDPLIIDLLGI